MKGVKKTYIHFPESNIKIFSRRNYRILRIWFAGKLPYAKRVKRWVNGQLFRDLQLIAPFHYEKYVEKYGSSMYDEFLSSLLPKTQLPEENNKDNE